MKITLFILSVACLISCNNNSGKQISDIPDTSLQLVLYTNPYDGRAFFDTVQRIIKDTFTYVYTDTLKNNKKERTADTTYILPVYVKVDTILAKKNGISVLDESGKNRWLLYKIRCLKSFVLIDGGKDVSEVLKTIPPPTIPQIDTTKKK